MPVMLSAFRWVPEFAQGHVKDLRVRWALEEAGVPYDVTLIDPAIQKSAAYRAWQPFGQVPAYRDDDVEMFESGAIVLHIAAASEALAPKNATGRARVASWVFAATTSLEPHVQNYNFLPEGDNEERRAQMKSRLKDRLDAVSTWLGDRDYLEDRFSAGDLVMSTVLRDAAASGLLKQLPNLDAYHQRCEARPAFGRALQAQMQPFRDNAPAG
ncbi:MAG: glutathione S-transferase family protein [Alphaproteobacteria bacterium]